MAQPAHTHSTQAASTARPVTPTSRAYTKQAMKLSIYHVDEDECTVNEKEHNHRRGGEAKTRKLSTMPQQESASAQKTLLNKDTICFTKQRTMGTVH